MKSDKHEHTSPTLEERTLLTQLEQLLSQRSQSALAGGVSDKDIDAVFDEELQNGS